jgi:hypothetical protein
LLAEFPRHGIRDSDSFTHPGERNPNKERIPYGRGKLGLEISLPIVVGHGRPTTMGLPPPGTSCPGRRRGYGFWVKEVEGKHTDFLTIFNFKPVTLLLQSGDCGNEDPRAAKQLSSRYAFSRTMNSLTKPTASR